MPSREERLAELGTPANIERWLMELSKTTPIPEKAIYDRTRWKVTRADGETLWNLWAISPDGACIEHYGQWGGEFIAIEMAIAIDKDVFDLIDGGAIHAFREQVAKIVYL